MGGLFGAGMGSMLGSLGSGSKEGVHKGGLVAGGLTGAALGGALGYALGKDSDKKLKRLKILNKKKSGLLEKMSKEGLTKEEKDDLYLLESATRLPFNVIV